MNKAQSATCAKCSTCGALVNLMFMAQGMCTWCRQRRYQK